MKLHLTITINLDALWLKNNLLLLFSYQRQVPGTHSNISWVSMCVQKIGWDGTFFREDWVTQFTQLGYLNRQKYTFHKLFKWTEMNWCLKWSFFTNGVGFQPRDHSETMPPPPRKVDRQHMLTQEISECTPAPHPSFRFADEIRSYTLRDLWLY